MVKIASALVFLLAACPAAALEITAVSPEEIKGEASGDFSFGPVTVTGITYSSGAVLMPVTENKGRKYTDIKLLSRDVYDRIEACFREGFEAPEKRPKAPKIEVHSLRPLRSKVRVANAEIRFDGELLVVAGVMLSNRKKGDLWVAFPPDVTFTVKSFKKAVEKAVKKAWAKKKKEQKKAGKKK